ncbi:MAG: hypothetical protein U5L95_05100 [Candidatus Saccharibacteria bacterium]|nr:hypothetical protein [Candidatus Saccharibacteria bacterium]
MSGENNPSPEGRELSISGTDWESEPGRPAPTGEPSEKVIAKREEMHDSIDQVRKTGEVATSSQVEAPPDDTTLGMPDLPEPEWLKKDPVIQAAKKKRISSSHTLSRVIGKEGVEELKQRKGTAEERRLNALRRLAGRDER